MVATIPEPLSCAETDPFGEVNWSFSCSGRTPSQLREMIETIRQFTGHCVRPICAALGVPRSSYYHVDVPKQAT